MKQTNKRTYDEHLDGKLGNSSPTKKIHVETTEEKEERETRIFYAIFDELDENPMISHLHEAERFMRLEEIFEYLDEDQKIDVVTCNNAMLEMMEEYDFGSEEDFYLETEDYMAKSINH